MSLHIIIVTSKHKNNVYIFCVFFYILLFYNAFFHYYVISLQYFLPLFCKRTLIWPVWHPFCAVSFWDIDRTKFTWQVFQVLKSVPFLTSPKTHYISIYFHVIMETTKFDIGEQFYDVHCIFLLTHFCYIILKNRKKNQYYLKSWQAKIEV